MKIIFEIKDRTVRVIHLSEERWKHILKHSKMNENQLDNIKNTIRSPMAVRYYRQDKWVRYFKQNPPEERYLIVSVKYLNGRGFVITSFFTNRITGTKWQTK